MSSISLLKNLVLLLLLLLLLVVVRVRATTNGLDSMSFTDCTLSPVFSTNTHFYTCTVPWKTATTTGTLGVESSHSFYYYKFSDTPQHTTDQTVSVLLLYGNNLLSVVMRRDRDNVILDDIQVLFTRLSPPAPTALPACTFTLEDDKYDYSCVAWNDIGSVTLDSFAATIELSTSAEMIGDGLLAVGVITPIYIRVPAEDKKSSTMYTFSVYRESIVSTLDNLVTDECSPPLWGRWSATRFEYNCTVGPSVTSVAVSSFYMTQGGDSVAASSVVTSAHALTMGSATYVSVTVTADDGVSQSVYTIAVYRQCNVATFASLAFTLASGCTLDPVWSAGTASYSCQVAHDVTSVVLRQESLLPSCGSTSATLSGNVGLLKGRTNTVRLVATADDDITTTTYTFAVHRLGAVRYEISMKLAFGFYY
jgi:hypothetical protein